MSAGLPLFDSARQSAGDTFLSVSQLTELIRRTLETDFARIAVEGEISNVRRPHSGHVYLCLKDDGCEIRAVIWRSAMRRIPFELQDGLAVRVWGSLTVYPNKGEYQIDVRKIEPVGTGPLELAFRQLVARLSAEGLFAQERKRPLPRYPRRVAIVTSPSGAAVRDIVRVARSRWPLTELIVVPSRVQGDGAARELVTAIGTAHALTDVDFLILARGGGSLEDLWCFNEEVLARAIVNSELPVVSAVGHEVDVTIADLVADLRVPTPTAAAAQCLPDQADVRHRLDALGSRLSRVLQSVARQARHRLETLERRVAVALERRLSQARQRFDHLAGCADRAMAREIERRRTAIATLEAKLASLSPLAVLARGYSLTEEAETGRVVRSATELHPGTLVRTRLARGTIECRVETIDA